MNTRSGIYRVTGTRLTEIHSNYQNASPAVTMAAFSIHQKIGLTVYFFNAHSKVESIIFNRITEEPLLVYANDVNSNLDYSDVIDAISLVDWDYERLITAVQLPMESST